MLPFCFVTSLGTVTVGWGLFQNILRSVPEKQREAAGLVALHARDPTGAPRGLRGARSRYPSPGWPPGPSRALSPSPFEPLHRGTEGGSSRGLAPAGVETAFVWRGQDRTVLCFV